MLWVSYCTMRDGYRHRLLERARRQRVRSFVSEYILEEITRTIVVLGHSSRFAKRAREEVLRRAKLVPLPAHVPAYVVQDPDDDAVVQTALSAKAHYLVTADHDILLVGKVQGIEIISPIQFEALLSPDD